MSTESLRLKLSYASPEALQQAIDKDLEKGRAFVPGHEQAAERQPCELVLAHPTLDASFKISAQVVWCDPNGSGVGLEFVDWGPTQIKALRSFAARTAKEPERRATNVYDRVRKLKPHEAQQLARNGGQAERIALERCFGGAVWEALLQNPQLTGHEVASIAKKGGLPRPVLAMIVANGAWVALSEVQRALLTNPRLESSAVTRILRAMTRPDLMRVGQQARYPARVRSEAKKLLAV
jgi:hypothetical protein